MAERIAIAGDGQMAIVLAASAVESGHSVRLWCPLAGAAAPLAASRRSPRLPEVELPTAVEITEDAASAFAGATLMLSAIPAQFAGETWRRVAPVAPRGVGIATVTKGVEVGSMHRPTQVLRAATGDGRSPRSAARRSRTSSRAGCPR